MTHSGTMEGIPQGGGFLIKSSLGSLGPVSEEHGVFSSGDLPSTKVGNQGQ